MLDFGYRGERKEREMNKDLMHLAQITMDNLPKGMASYTESEIIDAMAKAVEKEESMTMQLLKSHSVFGDPEKLAIFKSVMSNMLYSAFNS